MWNIQRFIDALAKEDVVLHLSVRRAPDGQYAARIQDPQSPKHDVLDVNGEMILHCKRDTIEEAIEDLDTLCRIGPS